MKVGQMISMVDFDGLPEDEQDELQRRLAALRDNVPPVPFADLEKLMRKEYGGPLAVGGCGPLRRADPVGGSHPRPPQALTRHQPADPRCPPEPAGRQLSRLRPIVGIRRHPPSLARTRFRPAASA